jgi:hypothetical protein
MATITKTPSGRWKVPIRKAGWPASIKTFPTKRDGEVWGRRLEDEMVRGAFIQWAAGDRMTVAAAVWLVSNWAEGTTEARRRSRPKLRAGLAKNG